jgi:hypothetical protein
VLEASSLTLKPGRHMIHWHPPVNGHRLRPGRYQFTVLGTPRRLRVR